MATATNAGESVPFNDNPFFERLVEASGLASLIAHAAVSRACHRAGIQTSALDRTTLALVMPHLEMTLKLYLAQDAELRLEALRALL